MKCYVLDKETYYVRQYDGTFWEFLKGFPPMLYLASESLAIRPELAPVGWDEVPEWAQQSINTLAEQGYIKGESCTF
jgi:hypothetical protein